MKIAHWETGIQRRRVTVRAFERIIAEGGQQTAMPPPGIANAAFGNEAVDVGIPFEVTSKGMQDTDKAGSKTFRSIGVLEHSEGNTLT